MDLIAKSVAKIISPISKRYGHHYNSIIFKWHEIVGSKLAEITCPKKITYQKLKHDSVAILHIDAQSSGCATELTFMEQIILEKISFYLGSKAIHKLKILHNPVMFANPSSEKAVSPPLSTIQKQTIALQLSGIEDDDLRHSLRVLGEMLTSAN